MTITCKVIKSTTISRCFPVRPDALSSTIFTVTSGTDDGGPGTLRSIAAAAPSDSLINFDPSVSIVTLESPLRVIANSGFAIIGNNSTTILGELYFSGVSNLYLENFRVYSINQIVGNFGRDALSISSCTGVTVNRITAAFGQDQTANVVFSNTVLVVNSIFGMCARGVGLLGYGGIDNFYLGNLFLHNNNRPALTNVGGTYKGVFQNNVVYNQNSFLSTDWDVEFDYVDNTFHAGPTRDPPTWYLSCGFGQTDPALYYYENNQQLRLSGAPSPIVDGDCAVGTAAFRNYPVTHRCMIDALDRQGKPYGTYSRDCFESALVSDYVNKTQTVFTETTGNPSGDYDVIAESTIYRDKDGTCTAPCSPYVIFEKQRIHSGTTIDFDISESIDTDGVSAHPVGTTYDLEVQGPDLVWHVVSTGLDEVGAGGTPGPEVAMLTAFDATGTGSIDLDWSAAVATDADETHTAIRLTIISGDGGDCATDTIALYQI